MYINVLTQLGWAWRSMVLQGTATAPCCCWQLNKFISASFVRCGGARAGVLHHSASCLLASGHGACNKYTAMTQVTAQAALPRQTWRDTYHPGHWMSVRHRLAWPSLSPCQSPSMTVANCQLAVPAHQPGRRHTQRIQARRPGQQRVPGSRQNCCSLC